MLSVAGTGQREPLDLSFVSNAWWPLFRVTGLKTGWGLIETMPPELLRVAVSISGSTNSALGGRRNRLPFVRKPSIVETGTVVWPGPAATGSH
jgi:hypothetical protein